MLLKTEKPLLIWTYHRVLPNHGNAAVSIDTFKQQIEYLIDKKYTFITTEELNSWLNGDLDKNKKFTMLTFDDGWGDNYFWAQPILNEYGIKATLAVNTGLIDTDSTWLRNVDKYSVLDSKKSLYKSAYGIDKTSFITKAELKAMHDSSVWDIQAHGSSHFGSYHSFAKTRGFYPEYSHWTMQHALGETIFEGAPRAEFRSTLAEPKTILDQKFIEMIKTAKNDIQRMQICKKYEKPILSSELRKEFLKRIVSDMLNCKNWLLDAINKDCNSMIWPWGHYSEDSIKMAEEIGFEYLFTMNKAAVNSQTSQFEIPRIAAPNNLKRFIHQEKVFSSQIKTAVRSFFQK